MMDNLAFVWVRSNPGSLCRWVNSFCFSIADHWGKVWSTTESGMPFFCTNLMSSLYMWSKLHVSLIIYAHHAHFYFCLVFVLFFLFSINRMTISWSEIVSQAISMILVQWILRVIWGDDLLFTHLFSKCLIHQECCLGWQMELVAVLMLSSSTDLNHSVLSIGRLSTPLL
jgi:hypothetical protein